MASGKSWATAAVQASRSIAASRGRATATSQQHERRHNHAGVSTKRLPPGPRGRARPSVHDGKHQPRQPEEREQQAAEKHGRGRQAVPGGEARRARCAAR
jgi:hypothetical protein